MLSIGRPHFAIFAGLLGSAASIFGKFISQTDEFINYFADNSEQVIFWKWFLKFLFISLMVICNIFVWVFFVKSLQEPGGSVVATVTSTSTNYCCSAIVGNLIFGERISASWWIGTLFVVIGLVFISMGNKSTEKDISTKKLK